MNFLSMLNLGALWGAFGALSLISLIWFGGPHVQLGAYKPLEPTWVRVLLSALIVLVVIGVNAYKWYKQQKLNKHVIEELKASELSSAEAEPRQKNQLSEQFNSIDLILQKHNDTQKKGFFQKLFVDKKDYIYQKPWFLVLGAPGVGKTTSILNSGLNFPIGTVENVAKLSGTKDCDWFLTDEALLLDTAGRFIEQDNQAKNSEDWKELLSLLKRCRPKQPINGLVLMVGVDDILKGDEDYIQNQLSEFRIRLQELQTSFNTMFPLYLLINKIDLIPGFDQYFNYLSEEDRSKVLGVQLDALSENSAEQINHIVERLDEISRTIELNIFHSVAYNNQQNEPSDLALSFASEFANFIANLKAYLKKLLNLSKYDSHLYLGGVYFSSSAQQSINHSQAPVNSRYSLKSKYSGEGTFGVVPKSKAYFLNHFYQFVLAETSNLAGVDAQWLKKQRRLYWGACVMLLLLSAGIITLMVQYYLKNANYLSIVNDNVTDAKKLANSVNASNAMELLDFADKVKTIPTRDIPESLLQTGPLNDVSFGKQAIINGAAQAKYRQLIEENLNGLIEESIEHRLSQGVSGGSSAGLYQHLKAYLMLHQSQHYDKKFIAQWVETNLVSGVLGGYDGESLAELNKILMARNIAPTHDYNAKLVQEARDLLTNQDLANIVYADLIQYAQTIDEKSLPSVSFVSMGGASTQNLFRRVSGKTLNAPMPVLYTKDGYRSLFLPYVTTRVSGFYKREKWVVGDGAFLISEEDTLSDIYQKYTDDYIAYWKQYIADVKMLEPKNLQQTIVMSKQLSEKKSALAGIIRGIVDNTNLIHVTDARTNSAQPQERSAPTADATTATTASPNPPAKASVPMDGYLQDVAANFSQFHILVQTSEGSSSQLDEITKSINDLYVYLVALQMSMQNNDALMPDNKPVVNYQAQISRLPEPFKPMLDQFVGQISQTSKDYQQSYKETQKQMEVDEEKKIVLAIAEQQDNSVKASCQSLIANKYPISKSASEEVSLKELEQVFGSKGLYLQTLNSNIMANNQPSTPFKTLLEGSNRQPIYENAQGINARYLAGADKPSLNFTLKVVSMDKDIKELIINYDANKMMYYHGPQKSMRVTWPTNTNALSLKAVTFDNQTHTIETKGEWAIFRLMDKATRTVNTKEGNGVIATFDFDKHDVHLELKSVSGANPFLLTGLRGFVC